MVWKPRAQKLQPVQWFWEVVWKNAARTMVWGGRLEENATSTMVWGGRLEESADSTMVWGERLEKVLTVQWFRSLGHKKHRQYNGFEALGPKCADITMVSWRSLEKWLAVTHCQSLGTPNAQTVQWFFEVVSS